MPKIKVNINKTNQGKINKFLKSVDLDNKEEFSNEFNKLLIEEIRYIRDCSEKNIVQYFIDATKDVLSSLENPVWKNEYFDIVKTKSRSNLVLKYTSNQTFNNNIDIYFNEVKREYILHPMNESYDIEFLPENRDIFIKNNLKLVINCAKRYRGLGLSFDDLIQVGNYGLLIAFDKFDLSRANLRKSIIDNINKHENEVFTYKDAVALISKNFVYDKLLDKTLKLLPIDGFKLKQEFIDWVMVNVKTAVFASVAFQWIKASILFELSHFSSTVHIPKSAIREGITPIVSLDSINPHTDDNYHDNQIAGVANEEFIIESETLEREESDMIYKDITNKLLCCLNELDRRLIKKRFGIGFPSPLSLNEIAESEGLPVNKVKHCITLAIKELSTKLTENEKNMLSDLWLID